MDMVGYAFETVQPHNRKNLFVVTYARKIYYFGHIFVLFCRLSFELFFSIVAMFSVD